MITNPEDLKTMSESKIVSKDTSQEKKERKSLSERMREKWHNTMFGNEEDPRISKKSIKEEISQESKE